MQMPQGRSLASASGSGQAIDLCFERSPFKSRPFQGINQERKKQPKEKVFGRDMLRALETLDQKRKAQRKRKNYRERGNRALVIVL